MVHWRPITSVRQGVIWIRGKTMNNQLVYGRFLQCCPGVCYVLRCGDEIFRIISDFEYSIIRPSPPAEEFKIEHQDIPYQTFILSMKTLGFWFKSEVSTKAYLTQEEIYRGVLIHPMSEEGLDKDIRPAPILNYSLSSLSGFKENSTYQSDTSNYFLETGELMGPIGPRGQSMVLMAEKINEQEIAWHLSRALRNRKQNQYRVRIEGSDEFYSTWYTFDDYSNNLHIECATPFKTIIYSTPLPYSTRPLYDDLPASPIPLDDSIIDLSVVTEEQEDEWPSQIDSY